MKPGVPGGLNIHVGIADEKRFLRLGRQLFQDGEYAVGGRFFGNPVPLAADGVEEAFPENLRAELLHKNIRLVGQHRQPGALPPQMIQKLQNAGVGAGLVQVMPVVPLVKAGLIVRYNAAFPHVFGKHALRQLVGPVAHKIAVGVRGVGGKTALPEHPVGGVRQVLQRVDQRAVQVKNITAKHPHHPYF